MITDNTQTIRLIKIIFYSGAFLMAVAALVLILARMDLPALFCGVTLILWFLAFQVVDFEYVQFGVENGKVLLRYYPAVKFGRKDYQQIEFPIRLLHDFYFENSIFGLVKDLVLVVKTKRGIAEYPSVSMAAVKKKDREKIEQALKALLANSKTL